MDTQEGIVADTGAEEGDLQTAPRDYEAEARAAGWTSKEEFKGDLARWVDAETFAKKADEIMPLLKAANKRLERELAQVKKDVAKASEFFSKAEERAYQRALSEIRAEQEAAVEAGDVTAHRKASDKLDKLREEIGSDIGPTAKGETVDQEMIDGFIEWRADNDWYDSNKAMTEYADMVARKLGPRQESKMSAEEYLAAVREKVEDRFGEKHPEMFGKKAKEPRVPPKNPVEGVSNARPRAGQKSFSDLPPEAQRMCDRFVKSGIVKDRAAYLSSYQWG